jgi:glycosyltransferase involved in cell wall biosynthesis
MNIGIDISSLIYNRGVSRYTSNLVRGLQLLPGLQLHLYGSSFRQHSALISQAKKLLKTSSTAQVQVDHYPPSLLSILWKLGFHALAPRMPKIAVFHSWDWLQPPDKNLPLVSTIHDLAILKYPETAHPNIVRMHKRSWEVLRKRDAQIIAVSQATKRDIVELLKIPAFRVHVILEALPEETKQTAEAITEIQYERIVTKLSLTNKPYILFVGTREPRKNLVRLIQAWQPLSQKVRLLVVGAEGWDESKHISGEQPTFLGHVDDATLSVLYSEAALFAYPSLYEGFGLPILEAFYHGTPVVTSNTSSMPEVAGNAAELVNPESTQEIHDAIEKILNETLADQQKRLQRMIIRLHMFDWKKTAEETLAVYQKAIQAHQDNVKFQNQ